MSEAKRRVLEDWFAAFAADEDQIIMDLERIDGTNAKFECGDGSFVFNYEGDRLEIAAEGPDSLVKRIVNKFKKKAADEDLRKSLEVFADISKSAALSAFDGGITDESEKDDDEVVDGRFHADAVKRDKVSAKASDDEYVYEEEDDYEDGNVTGSGNCDSTWLSEYYMKKKWIAKEAEIRSRRAKEETLLARRTAAVPMSSKPRCDLFSPEASSKVLTSDLLLLMRECQELGYSVSPIDDDIYNWNVKLHRFHADSPLAMDLIMLDDSFGYSYVELQIQFAMDMHPFYPPLVTIKRPRFEGFMLGRIATLKFLQLSQWDPLLGTKEVISSIRKELEACGRIDLRSPLNCLETHSLGAYIPLEHQLLKLGLVTEIVPRVQLVSELRAAERAAKQLEVVRKLRELTAAASSSSSSSSSSTSMEVVAEDGSKAETASSEDVLERKRKADNEVDAPPPKSKEHSDTHISEHEGAAMEVEATSSSTGPPSSSSAAAAASEDAVANIYDSAAALAAAVAAIDYNSASTSTSAPKASAAEQLIHFKVTSTATTQKPEYWAKGTGYGHGSTKNKSGGGGWDIDAYLAAQKEQDRLRASLLCDLFQELRRMLLTAGEGEEPDSGSKQSSDSSSSSSSSCFAMAPTAATTAATTAAVDGTTETVSSKPPAAAVAMADTASATGAATTNPSSYSSSVAAAVLASDGGDGGWLELQGRLRVILEESCLLPLLEGCLQNESLLDIERHREVYYTMYQILHVLAECEGLQDLLLPQVAQGSSLAALAAKLESRLEVYLRTSAKAGNVLDGSGSGTATGAGAVKPPSKNFSYTAAISNPKIHPSSSSSAAAMSSASASASLSVAMTIDEAIARGDVKISALTDPLQLGSKEESLTNYIIFVTKEVRAAAERASQNRSEALARELSSKDNDNDDHSLLSKQRSYGGKATDEAADPDAAAAELALRTDQERVYKEIMAPLQYIELETLANYHYQKKLVEVLVAGNVKSRVRRLAKEHSDLSHSLPLSLSSSVWMRTSADRMDIVRFMISGPEDTPYSNGLFIFDAYFPETYPDTAPQVNLQTTGNGTVRFNPNLYHCGKVCLSLLGTWAGDPSESWNSSTSTFLQVLVSIQSLIMVPEPYFNEPGYEQSMGSQSGRAQSDQYNAHILQGTIRWAMIDQLQKPKPGFEEVTRTHFRLRRRHIMKELLRYCEWTAEQASDALTSAGVAAALIEEEGVKQAGGGGTAVATSTTTTADVSTAPPPPPTSPLAYETRKLYVTLAGLLNAL